MTGEPVITVVGNLTADPEARATNNGTPVANFTIAATPRQFNKQTNQWEDGETLFQRCTAWQPENIINTLQKGMRVIASGPLKARSWDDRNTGQKRTEHEMEVQEIGPSLKYAVAQVHKVPVGQQGGRQQAPQGQQGQEPWGAPQGQQAWGQPNQGPPQGQQGSWAGPPPAQREDPWANPQQAAPAPAPGPGYREPSF